jgi:hypothetical protein
MQVQCKLYFCMQKVIVVLRIAKSATKYLPKIPTIVTVAMQQQIDTISYLFIFVY